MKVPFSYGIIQVAVPGTPQKLQPTTPTNVKGFHLTPVTVNGGAIVPNSGFIYIGDSTLNKATGVGVVRMLSPLQAEGIDIDLADATDLSQWFIDADQPDDGVLISTLKDA